jgi:hypothetical protein
MPRSTQLPLARRCADLAAKGRGQTRFLRVLMVIPGPKEPASLDPYLKRVLEELQEGAPPACAAAQASASSSTAPAQGTGFELLQRRRQADGSITTSTARVHVVLTAQHADTPANRKMTKWMSHTAQRGCGYCVLMGKKAPGGGMCFGGYQQPTA